MSERRNELFIVDILVASFKIRYADGNNVVIIVNNIS